MDEISKQNDWEDALLLFRFNHDTSAIITMLRSLYVPNEIPDLDFLADLLEGKYKLGKGRPPKHKIRTGVKQEIAAKTVETFILNDNLSVEEALIQASEMLYMSESFVKKSYYKLREQNKQSLDNINS